MEIITTQANTHVHGVVFEAKKDGDTFIVATAPSLGIMLQIAGAHLAMLEFAGMMQDLDVQDAATGRLIGSSAAAAWDEPSDVEALDFSKFDSVSAIGINGGVIKTGLVLATYPEQVNTELHDQLEVLAHNDDDGEVCCNKLNEYLTSKGITTHVVEQDSEEADA